MIKRVGKKTLNRELQIFIFPVDLISYLVDLPSPGFMFMVQMYFILILPVSKF